MAYATLDLCNFAEIDQTLGNSRSLPLALNTFAYRTGVDETEIAISYHGNDIAIYDTKDRSITLTTSGWTTPTTIDRLHQIARGNDLGFVGIVGGRARFTHRAKDHGWYHLEDSITIYRDGKVEHNDPDRDDSNGYSNHDTYLTAAWCHNPEGGETEHNAILNMRRSELRGYVKSNRKNIGYQSIADVNMPEIQDSLKEDQ